MSTVWPLMTSCDWAFRVSLPPASIVTSPSALMTMLLSLVLMTMLLASLASMISICSCPSVSVRRMTAPLREVIERLSFLPSELDSGGLSLPFHRPPMT